MPASGIYRWSLLVQLMYTTIYLLDHDRRPISIYISLTKQMLHSLLVKAKVDYARQNCLIGKVGKMMGYIIN